MTRNAKRSNRLSRRLLLATPILAVAIVGLILYASVTGSYAMNTHAYLMITITRGTYVKYVIPDKTIGIPGGYMSTSKYLSDGVNGNYPLFASPNYCGNVTGTGDMCLIRTVSKVVRSYTLGDFFAVWGVPLGPDLTLSPSYRSNSTYSWTMCTSNNGNPYEPTEAWGNHVLVTGEVILLSFSTFGC